MAYTGYGSKLGNMVHVVGLLESDSPLTFLESLSSDDDSIGKVLFALKAAKDAFGAFEYSKEQLEEIAALEKTLLEKAQVNIDEIALSEILQVNDTEKSLAIMASIPERKAKLATEVAEVQGKLDALRSAAQKAAEKAFASAMSGKSASLDYPYTGVVVRCKYDRNKRSVMVVVHSATDWRIYTPKDGQNKVIGYNSNDHADSPTMTSLSFVRKIADCFRKDLPFTAANLAKQTMGVGDPIDEKDTSKGGTYATIVSNDPVAWEKAQAASAKKAKSTKANPEEKNHD